MFPPIFGTILASAQAELDSENISLPNLRQNRRSAGNRHRNRGYALEEISHISNGTFSTMFRMSREGFEELFNLTSPFMHDTNEHMAKVSAGSALSKRTKLYATLRWLAGGSYLDICFAWGLSKAAFFSTHSEWGVVWPVVDAIDAAFAIGLPLNNVEELQKLADEFAVLSHGQLPGAVTAIDGWVAQTRKPFLSEVDDIMAYRNRHGCWGLVVLAGCDARCRFTMFSCKNSGSTNDCIAWELSLLKKLVIDEGKLPAQFFLIGDEAFTCVNQFLVPYSGRGLGTWKDSFNFHLSAMRQVIERAFAILVQRWGILWRSLRCSFERWTTLLTVLAKLHNFCLDKNIPLYRNRFFEDEESEDEPEVVLNSNADDARDELANAANTYSNRRANFTRDLELQGIRRPRHASMNSRA